MVLSPEHVGAAGLPQEAVAGRHPDSVPGEANKGEALFIKCPAVEEFNLTEKFLLYARFIE